MYSMWSSRLLPKVPRDCPPTQFWFFPTSAAHFNTACGLGCVQAAVRANYPLGLDLGSKLDRFQVMLEMDSSSHSVPNSNV